MIKLIASDLDGTLMRNDRSVPEEFYSLYREMARRGVTFVAASGNQASTLTDILSPIADDLTFISDNGARVVLNGTPVFEEPIPKEALLASLTLLEDFPELLPVCSNSECALIRESDRRRAGPALIYLKTYRYVTDLKAHADGVFKLAMCRLDGDVFETAERFRPRLPDGVRLVTSGNGWMDIVSDRAGKGGALAWLQRYLGVSPEETAAFGDQMNDADMMRRAGYSCAVRNADPELFGVARYVVPSNEEDGVVRTIRRMLDGEF